MPEDFPSSAFPGSSATPVSPPASGGELRSRTSHGSDAQCSTRIRTGSLDGGDFARVSASLILDTSSALRMAVSLSLRTLAMARICSSGAASSKIRMTKPVRRFLKSCRRSALLNIGSATWNSSYTNEAVGDWHYWLAQGYQF